MFEENIVDIDTTTDDVQVDTEETTAPATNEVDVAKLQETNKRLFERAKKAEEIARKAKESLKAPPSPTINDDIVKKVEKLELSEKKREVQFELGLSPEETDKLFKFAGSADPREAFKDPFFQAGLEAVRREKKIAEAIPSGNNRTTKVEGKTFAEMSPEERAKNWSKIVKR